MDSRIQIDAILSNLMDMTENGVNVTQLKVDYEAGTVFIVVGS
jgi:hypothetical protein